MADPAAADWSARREAERLEALRRYAVLDTAPEIAFDDAAALVRTICRVPIALVSLVDADRQWFKAASGTDLRETGLDTSVCALAIRQDDLFCIKDLAADPRTAAMSLVAEAPHLRFYAGAPIVTADGLPLGSLCAIDVAPRPGGLDPEQAAALKALARQVMALLESRAAIAVRDATLGELRLGNEQIRLGRERLELATRAARLGSFDYLPQTGVLDWDDRCRELFGLPPGVPVSYAGSFLAYLHPQDRDAAAATVARALEPGGSGTFEMEYRTIGATDGAERSVAAHGLALFEDGVAVRLIGTVQDVTSKRRRLATLFETEERLRLAVRATNDAVWDWSLRSDHVRWNDALERVYGHDLATAEPSGAWWLDQIHPDDRPHVERSMHAFVESDASDWTDEYRFRRGDGSYADVCNRGYVIRDEAGRAVRMIGALLDQSDRKAIERSLHARNERLAISVSERTEELDRLWDTSPDLLAVLDLDGTLIRVNAAWTQILGWESHELLGRKIDMLVVPEDRERTRAAFAAAAVGPPPPLENRYRHRDGSVRWFSWVAAPTEREIYATGRHVTAQKEAEDALRYAEDQLRQAQKVEAIGHLTGGVAHDFNNLLTVIRGSIDLLRRPDLSEQRRARYIDAIADTADRAIRLTSQLLAFARRSALKPEIFDAGGGVRALRDVIGTLTGSRIAIAVDLAEQACFVNADPSQFDTAIVNMAVNARDAMDNQGELRITVRAVSEMPPVRSHPAVRGDYVAVAISDTGCGIAADKIEHIFEPFFTTKAVGEGTGLGLSQVFGFAKQSGGEVQVESDPPNGTTFTLYLPRAGEGGESDETRADRAVAIGQGACILVVEDNPEVGSFAVQALDELGYNSVLAIDATEALARLAAPESGFDVVFSDVMMPGMTGIELGREIRARFPDMPILLTSGYSDVLAREGTDGFDLLHKPYSIDELAAALGHSARTMPD